MTRRWSSGSLPLAAAVLMSAGVYLGFGLGGITVFATVGVDESWYTQSAWSFVKDGTFALPMFGDLADFDRDNVVYGRVYLLLMAMAYAVADVDPSAVKAVSLVSGFVALGAVFAVGQELWDRRVGATAALLLALSPNFVLQSWDARPEVMLMAASMVALYLVLSGARQGSTWRLLAGGLVAGLCVDIHFNGVVFPPALLLVLLWRRTSARQLALFLLGLAVAFVWWMSIHVIPDPAMFRAQLDAFSTASLPLGEALTRPAQVFGLELLRSVLVLPRSSVLLVWVAALAAVVLLRHHRDRALTTLLVFGTAVFVLMALVLPHRIHLYAILLWPVFALLAARLLDVSPRRIALGLGGVLVVVFIATLVLVAWERVQSDYDRYIGLLKEHIPAGATVQGDPILWFGFSDQPFIASHFFVLTDDYASEVERLGVEYVVRDVPTIGGCEDCSYADDVGGYLAEHAELMAEVQDPYYGSFVGSVGGSLATPVYRIVD